MIDFFDHMFIVKQSAKGELLSYCLVTVMNECMSGLKLRQLVNAFNHHYIIEQTLYCELCLFYLSYAKFNVNLNIFITVMHTGIQKSVTTLKISFALKSKNI